MSLRKVVAMFSAAIGLVAAHATVASDASAATITRHYGAANGTGCLDAKSYEGGQRAYVLGCNSGNYQKWRETGLSWGHVILANQAFNRCLNYATTTRVVLGPCDTNNPKQRWEKIPADLAGHDGYMFRNYWNGRCLKAPSSSGSWVLTTATCNLDDPSLRWVYVN